LKPEHSRITTEQLDAASPETRAAVERIAWGVAKRLQERGYAAKGVMLSDEDTARIVAQLIAAQFGTGELEALFNESDVEDIVINTVPVTRNQARVEVFTFRQSGKRRESIDMSPDEVIELVNRSARAQGRALTPLTPILNAQLLGTARIARVNAVLDPICDPQLSVTIRIHRLAARAFDDLVRLGTLSEAAASWLWLCVQARLALVVGGGTSSGKTNFLNALCALLPADERVVCIEDTRELDLSIADKVYLTTVAAPTASADPARMVTQRQLVANALRMRPDRIVLGEVRDAAAFDALKATNTGHDGTLLTVHAEDAEGVIKRLMQLASEAPETAQMPERTLQDYIAAAFQTVVFLKRVRAPSGATRRFVTEIVDVSGYVQNGRISQHKLFERRGGAETGALVWTRNWPHERSKTRILEAGFSEAHIEAALNGQRKLWREAL
jgi:pilus assembly protein CpaF